MDGGEGRNEAGAYWDEQAASFDDAPDHGLRDPAIRAAWRELLLPLMPPVPARIADLGCGTGSLAVLLAGAGYLVSGLDRWLALLRPGGRLVLIEGRWWTGAGIGSDEVRRLLNARGRTAELTVLADDALWGRAVDDERYLVVSDPCRGQATGADRGPSMGSVR